MPFICFLFPKTRSEKLSEDLDEYDYFDTTPVAWVSLLRRPRNSRSRLTARTRRNTHRRKPFMTICCEGDSCRLPWRTRVLEEENEEEEDDNIDFMQFNSFADTFMGDDADDEDSTDALAQTLHDAKEYCDNERD
ncbi:hypothetical protein U9M48_019149 [Paspalum notatum var. saurae]|uniref:Uncharacterized protein n=1 Tax=Paspalum notatum var. saurae TaxID=547442 RepID=A0AAQ3TF30_PASNO